jgi:hypothetical protein
MIVTGENNPRTAENDEAGAPVRRVYLLSEASRMLVYKVELKPQTLALLNPYSS